MSSSELKSKLVRLSELGPRMVVITGVSTLTRRLCNVGYDRDHNAFWLVASDYVPVAYPGTGDIFASVLTGAILGGDSLPIAIERASRFVERVIKTTFSYGTDTRYGVMLERVLPLPLRPRHHRQLRSPLARAGMAGDEKFSCSASLFLFSMRILPGVDRRGLGKLKGRPIHTRWPRTISSEREESSDENHHHEHGQGHRCRHDGRRRIGCRRQQNGPDQPAPAQKDGR